MPLKLVRRHGAANWYLRGTVRGRRVDESAGTGDRKVAEEIRAKREAELLEESIHGRRATMTFAQAAYDYLQNADGNRRFMDKVLKHFGTTPLARIDQSAIETGARKVFPKASPATRDRQFFTPTSAVLHHAAQRGWCPKPTIKRPTKPPGRVRWLKYEEAERLIAACSDHLRPLVIFLLYTGARAGEALWLDWSNLHLDRRHVDFIDTKNGEARGVRLHARVVEALEGLKHRTGRVFRRPDGKPYTRSEDVDHVSAGSKIKTGFRGACRRAGIENFHPHDCRHTWATWHYQINRDLGALQRLGGWKSLSMVMRYAHTNVDEVGATIDRLPGEQLGKVQSLIDKTA